MAGEAGIIAGVAQGTGILDQVGYGLGELTGYNDALKRDQIEQYKAQSEIQHGYNLEAMKQQQEYQKQMYDYTYSRTTPQQQVKNLKEAGLNPALAYGGGAGGASGITGQSSALGVGTPSMESLASMRNKMKGNFNLLESLQQAKQIELTEANIKNVNADTANKEATNPKIIAETQLVNAQTGIAEVDNRLKNLEAEFKTITNKNADEMQRNEINLMYEQANKAFSEYVLLGLEYRVKHPVEQAMTENIKATLTETLSKAKQAETGAKLNEAEIAEIKSIVNKNLEEVKRINAEVRLTEKDIENYTWRMMNESGKAVGVLLGSVPSKGKTPTKAATTATAGQK